MANGNIVNPLGCWEGKVELGSATVAGSFEVFDSGRGWDFLFGKRLMTAFAAVHNYAVDEVFIPEHQLTLQNQYAICYKPQAQHENETCEDKKGDKTQSPVRGVPTDLINADLQVINIHALATTPSYGDTEAHEQPTTDEESKEDGQETSVGNRATFPPREVPTGTTTDLEVTADEPSSHRVTIEEVEDDDDPGRNRRKTEKGKAETTTQSQEDRQRVKANEQKRQKERARESARAMWKKWK